MSKDSYKSWSWQCIRTHHSLVIVNSSDHISVPHPLHHRTVWIQDQRLKLQNRLHLSTYVPVAAKKPILRLWLSAVNCQKMQFSFPNFFPKLSSGTGVCRAQGALQQKTTPSEKQFCRMGGKG